MARWLLASKIARFRTAYLSYLGRTVVLALGDLDDFTLCLGHWAISVHDWPVLASRAGQRRRRRATLGIRGRRRR